MHQTMIGGACFLWSVFWLVLIVALIVTVRGRHRGNWRPERGQVDRGQVDRGQGAPEAILRERFARGEITRDQYREVLVEFLKERYVRGELTLEEYESRLSFLMGERGNRPPPHDTPAGG